MAHLPALVGAEPMARFKRLIGQLDTLHPQYAPEPHWYLAMLGSSWPKNGSRSLLMAAKKNS